MKGGIEMQRMTIDFGIDLGTTNSTIAVVDDIDAKVIPNKVGSNITPSAFWIDKRGQVHVGQEAKLRALIDDPKNGDLEFKLRMGRGNEGKKVFERSGREMLPEELSAEVLKSLKMDVQTNMGEELRAAVVTVPAAFENPQTAATRRAACGTTKKEVEQGAKEMEGAGFKHCVLLLEPVAASLAYGFQSESENVYWMVYDFGGGTFDAAIMRIRDGLIHVVNHDGDNFLGGKLIDWDIVTKKLVPAITAQYNLPDFRRENLRWERVFGRMKYHAELAKIEVCRSRAPHEFWIEGFEDADGKEVDFAFTLSPKDVQEVSRPYIEKSLSLCRKTLEHEGLMGANLERILMVGGTTLNPWVREAVQAELGGNLEFGIDPVTVVARGAAIFAGTQIFRDEEAVVPTGTWRIQIEHKPVDNVSDPDIGGRVTPPDGRNIEGYTIELVDTKTQWRSGRITLGADGVFMTQLFAEKQRRHEYAIELCDATGTRIPTSPDRVSYTLGVVPGDPPAAMTIGVGLANGGVATYVEKGAKIPERGLRKSMDHRTTEMIRAGRAEDILRIPLLEGEHPRAERNHGIGVMTICGTDIRRDLTPGSQIEITLIIDQSQQVRLQAYVNSLDEDFEISFNPQMKHSSMEELRKEADQQKLRLKDAREKAEQTKALKADEALSRIDNQQLIDHVASLIEAAENDPDAVAELDRRLRELAAEIDQVEDSLEWPVLLAQAEESLQNAERVVGEYGKAADQNHLNSLRIELQTAIDTGDPDLLRRHIATIDALFLHVLDQQPGFHVGRFNWLVEKAQSMRDPGLAEQIITQGRRATNNNDVEALKAANRQLLSLLPREIQQEAKHANIGGTITMN
ncbi:MAG: Hsp70 family protein [Desulfobacteraceae bacterium]|nr:MAG: Hsp70 family protein [Desulfobacteraceae bacterium]